MRELAYLDTKMYQYSENDKKESLKSMKFILGYLIFKIYCLKVE